MARHSPTLLSLVLVVLSVLLPLGVLAKDAPREIDWLELIPPDELKALEQMPTIDHDGGRMEQLMTSANTVAAMDGVRGKLPGYLVPISGDDLLVSEFFFVPYFGACLHMPPPPPNQIVYVKPAKAIAPGSMWDAFWIVGTLRVSRTENDMAISAYSLDLESIEVMEAQW